MNGLKPICVFNRPSALLGRSQKPSKTNANASKSQESSRPSSRHILMTRPGPRRKVKTSQHRLGDLVGPSPESQYHSQNPTTPFAGASASSKIKLKVRRKCVSERAVCLATLYSCWDKGCPLRNHAQKHCAIVKVLLCVVQNSQGV